MTSLFAPLAPTQYSRAESIVASEEYCLETLAQRLHEVKLWQGQVKS